MEHPSAIPKKLEDVPPQTSSVHIMEVVKTEKMEDWDESENDSPDARSFCRTCMENLSESGSGFTNFVNVPQVAEMIEACTTIQICSNEGLPEQVCNTCITSLAMAYEFRQRCARVDREVKLFFKTGSFTSDQIKQEPVDVIDIKTEKIDLLDCANDSQDFDNKSLISEKYDISDVTNICKDSHELNSESHKNLTVEINKNEDIEIYHENQTENYNKGEEPYFRTDVNNLIQYWKAKNSCSIKPSTVNCDICKKTCRSIHSLIQHLLVHTDDRPYVCEICRKGFKEHTTLRRHMSTHMEKQHQCDICNKYFVEKSSLRRHISTIHIDFKPGSLDFQNNLKEQYSCFKCKKVFRSQAKYNMHLKMHGNPNFECETCGNVYAGRSHLRMHRRIHTGEKPYVCSMCDMKFNVKHALKNHYIRVHKIHTKTKLKCKVCCQSFSKESDLLRHASCHPVNMKKNNHSHSSHKSSKKSISSIKKSKNMLSDRKNDGSCVAFGVIPKLFAQLLDLVPERNTSSDDNNMDDIDKSNFIDIKEEICESPKPLAAQVPKTKVCSKCCKGFERRGDLKRHIISHIIEDVIKKAKEQNTVPSYKCEICFSVLEQEDKFKKHLREHAQLTLYQCNICGRAFGDSSNFSKHKKVHGMSFLKCTICNRKFNTNRMMVMHMEYHKRNQPKACSYCKKVFHFDSNLQKHIKQVHLGESRVTYRCKECGEGFKSTKLRLDHQWDVHKMRKVNADCHICNAQFRKMSLLRAHLVKIHSLDSKKINI